MNIKTNEYEVRHEVATHTAFFKGSLRLSSTQEYAPIVQLLDEAASHNPATVTLDLRELEFLNSSGINILARFVIGVRQKGNIQMVVQGSKKFSWQAKSLQNLQRLMPGLQLSVE